jgi:hypothetical protein
MSSETLERRSCFARFPKTKSIASMTFDLPEPLGPTTEEKDCGRRGGVSGGGAGGGFGCVGRRGTARAHLVERPHALCAGIGLEVLQNHVRDHEARLAPLLLSHRCGQFGGTRRAAGAVRRGLGVAGRRPGVGE